MPNPIEDDCDGIQCEGMKRIIPSNDIYFWKRLEVLLGLKLSGHIDTLTEASNLLDEFLKKGEVKIEQHYRNAHDIVCAK